MDWPRTIGTSSNKKQETKHTCHNNGGWRQRLFNLFSSIHAFLCHFVFSQCAAAYAFYNIFIKKGSASINPILGGVILQFVAALLGTVLLGGLVWKEGGAEVITYDYWGVFWAVCAGLAVGVAEMLSFCVSGMGVQATQSIPIIIGGSVMFGSVLGAVLLHEQMTMHGWSGVVLLVIGICFVATDPGVKMAAH
jgi:transporter family protein